MNELDSLFGDLGGFTDDVKAYGLMGVGAVGGTVAWRMVTNNAAIAGLVAKIPMADKILPVAEVAAGVFLGNYLRRYNNLLGQGVAVGMAADGIITLVKNVAPDMASKIGLAGLGESEEYLLAGLGEEDVFSRYLNAAPASVEEVSGTEVEEVAGLSDVEEINSVLM